MIKKTKLYFCTLFILFFVLNKTSLAIDDKFIIENNIKIFDDTNKSIENSEYFSFIIKNINTEKTYTINSNQVNTRLSPASTFKIPLSLMGFDSNILIDEKNPVLKYNSEYNVSLDSWKSEHNPASWMKYSVVWYSQELTIMMGMKNFKKYIELFDYGNKDITGNSKRGSFIIKNSEYVSFAGLINSWLSSSLKISAFEQIEFLEKLIENKLPVSQKSMDLTKKIIYRGKLKNNLDLYGKTGTAQYNIDNKNQIRILWFVGFLEKDNNKYVFASNRLVNVLPDSSYYPFADDISKYLENNFSKFKLD